MTWFACFIKTIPANHSCVSNVGRAVGDDPLRVVFAGEFVDSSLAVTTPGHVVCSSDWLHVCSVVCRGSFIAVSTAP